jgi:hypothetical protein
VILRVIVTTAQGEARESGEYSTGSAVFSPPATTNAGYIFKALALSLKVGNNADTQFLPLKGDLGCQ